MIMRSIMIPNHHKRGGGIIDDHQHSRRRRQTTTTKKWPTRIGIGFCNIIAETSRHDHHENEYPKVPFALEMIQHLVYKFGPENVFMIVKADPLAEESIRDWLDRHDFYQRTGFLAANGSCCSCGGGDSSSFQQEEEEEEQQQQLIFVRRYQDKKQIVEEKRISIFLDDHRDVVASLASVVYMERVFWMNLVQKEEQKKKQKLISQGAQKIVTTRRYRIKVVAVNKSWSKTMKYFQKIPTQQENK